MNFLRVRRADHSMVVFDGPQSGSFAYDAVPDVVGEGAADSTGLRGERAAGCVELAVTDLVRHRVFGRGRPR
jgi:hypothetical protein